MHKSGALSRSQAGNLPCGEVHGGPVAALLQACEGHGLATDGLLHELSFSREDVLDRHCRVSWDDYALFLDRVEALVGGPRKMEELSLDVIVSNRAMQLVGRLFVNPRWLFLIGAESVARRINGIELACRCVAQDDSRLRLTYRIPRHRRGSLGFLHATAGALRAYPRLVGYSPAGVVTCGDPWAGDFEITLPQDRPVVGEVLQAIGRPVLQLFKTLAHGQLDGPLSDKDMDLALSVMMDDMPIRDVAARLGQGLIGQASEANVGAELRVVLRQCFLSGHLRLWVAGGERERPLADDDAGVDWSERALAVGGRRVGRIQVENAVATSPLFEALLPWIGAALDVHTASKTAARIERATHSWSLTLRQRQVLELLANGLANKEIAQGLCCSVKTVEVHVGQLLRKSGTDSRTALIARFWSFI